MADSTFLNTEKVQIDAFPEDASNSPAAVLPGSYGWISEPAGVVALTPSADGVTCEARGVAAGICLVTCTALNLAGSSISGAVTLEVTEAPVPLADHIRLVVSAPSPQ
jgi:hypothetical protein